ncbi:MAG: hypothetical protein ACXAC5_01820 [Promethearchaeota archaeon]
MVLGRGKSVLTYAEHSSKFRRIYIVNTFNDEIQAIGEEYFSGKELIHIQGPGFDHALVNYDLFSSVRIIKNDISVTPVMMQRGYIATTTWEEVLEKSDEEPNHKALVTRLDEDHETQLVEWKKMRPHISGRTWPTIGLFAIEFVLATEQLKELYLFGFDFYESDYVTKPVKFYKTTPIIAAMMKYHLEQLIDEFSEICFYIVTASKSFRPRKSNCVVIPA